MAYLEEIYPPKCTKGCGRLAKFKLLTIRNSRYGDYCSQHAEPMLKFVLEREQIDFARELEADRERGEMALAMQRRAQGERKD